MTKWLHLVAKQFMNESQVFHTDLTYSTRSMKSTGATNNINNGSVLLNHL